MIKVIFLLLYQKYILAKFYNYILGKITSDELYLLDTISMWGVGVFIILISYVSVSLLK